MIALRIIVFYPLMLYKYVYVLVNRYRRYKTNPVRMGLIWYGIGEKVLFFYYVRMFEVISSRIACELFFERAQSTYRFLYSVCI